MRGFLSTFAIIGLPVFAYTACLIWKPVRRDLKPKAARTLANRILWTIAALVVSAWLVFPLFWLPAMIWKIWKPAAAWAPTADRIAWTIFVLGVCLMTTMTLYAVLQERDGDWRTWDTIRLHTRIFLGLSLIPVAGPLVVYLGQATRKHSPSVSDKKPPVDDWGEANRPVVRP